eukprot:gene46811-57319_t
MSAKRSKWDSDSDDEAASKTAKTSSKEPKAQKPSKDNSKSTQDMSKDESGSKRKRALSPPLLSSLVPSTHTLGHASAQSMPPDDATTALPIATKPTSIDRYIGPCRSVENYQPLNYIDQGTYGTVFRALCLATKEEYALKQIKLPESATRNGFPIT